MRLGADELQAIERAVVRGWPALEIARIGGWVLRWSSGGSVRANTVAPLAFDGSASLDDMIAAAEAFYRARRGAPAFTISGSAQPPGLDAALAARGWRRTGDHVTMAKRLPGTKPAPPDATSVAGRDGSDAAWYDAYLQGLTPDRRGIARRLVEGVPPPRRFFSAMRDGRTIASGLSVLDGTLASVQCMATLPEARRTGAATAVLAAIEAWATVNGARLIYLQTDAENAAAIGLYARFSFSPVDRYHTRVLDQR